MHFTAKADVEVLKALPAGGPPPFDFAAAPWSACQGHAPFVFQQSDLAVREQTTVRLLYDDAHLHIGIACALEKPVPDPGPVAHQGEHVEVFLDPGNTRTASLQFAVNAAGATFGFDHRQPESETTRAPWWRGWTAETRRADDRWETVIRIPLPQPPAAGALWGLNVFRCHVNLGGISSWRSYSEGFDAPGEYGVFAFGAAPVKGLPEALKPVRWPARVPARPLEYHLTVDPPDDFLGWELDPARLENYFRFFADWGVKRVYWIDYGVYDPAFFDCWVSGKPAAAARIRRSLASFGNDPLPAAVAAAHRLGLELYTEVKPWDWGSCLIHPRNRERADLKGLDRVGGKAYPRRAFVDHPEWNMARTPLGCGDGGRAIAEIVLMKDDDAPVPFAAEGITLWASDGNCGYRPLDGFSVTQAVEDAPVLRKTIAGAEETGERRRVRVIRIGNIRAADRYLALEIPGRSGRFANRAFALARAFDKEGREIPVSRAYLSVNGNWAGGGGGWKANGLYFEMSGATSEPGGLTAPWELDNSCGVLGLARGRNRWIAGAPEPADPAAAEWILDWVRRAAACKADGFEYRVRNHQVSVEWEAYGYSAAAQAAFRNEHGRDLRPDGSDFEALCEFRGRCYTDILRRAKRLCAAAGIPLGLQVTPDLYAERPDACTMGIRFDWRAWLREGIADQMLTKYISPFSPIFRDVRRETTKAGIPFYAEFERHFHNPDAPAIYRNYFDAARRAGADAVNLYEAANLARIDESGATVAKHAAFTEFVRYFAVRGPEARRL